LKNECIILGDTNLQNVAEIKGLEGAHPVRSLNRGDTATTVAKAVHRPYDSFIFHTAGTLLPKAVGFAPMSVEIVTGAGPLKGKTRSYGYEFSDHHLVHFTLVP
jgi:hypothetical protein